MDKKYVVPGYSGYIPGDKWRFGSRSSSEPPPLWRNYNGVAAQQENLVTVQLEPRPPSRKQRFQSAKGGRIRSENYLESIAYRPMDSSTQFPVQTTEMATQADVEGMPGVPFGVDGPPIQVPMQNESVVIDPGRRGRPPSRAGRPQLDGRVINHQRPGVLFMPTDPFKDLTYEPRRLGRNYQNEGARYAQNGQGYSVTNGKTAMNGQNGLFLNDGFPTSGYSGHIPGMKTFIGKPYGDALRVLREGQQKTAL